jgi:transcriptional regulator with XRE-family HTH domain
MGKSKTHEVRVHLFCPERLRGSRKLAGLNMKQLAQRVGVTYGTIVNYENGRSQPSLDMLSALCAAVGMDVCRMFVLTTVTVERLDDGGLKLTPDPPLTLDSGFDQLLAAVAAAHPDP